MESFVDGKDDALGPADEILERHVTLIAAAAYEGISGQICFFSFSATRGAK